MKKRIILSFGLLIASIIVFAQPVTKRVGLAWNHPDVSSVDVFILLHSTDVNIPMVNWEVFAEIPSPATNYSFDIIPGKHFFTIVCSNFWGQSSDFSNVASTPALPQSPNTLSIHRE